MGSAASITSGVPMLLKYGSPEIEVMQEPPGAEGLLTREMLNNLARNNISPSRRLSSSRAGFPRSQLSEIGGREVQIPASVTKLLGRIGITTAENDTDYHEQKSKLVSHIFGCLGALQALVTAADLTFDPDLETQSVCERDTKAMGKLLHEMVSIYGLCGDTITILLSSNPAAASVEDSIGRLPLHVAVDCDSPWAVVVQELLETYPRACKERDGAGRLPLHVVLDRPRPCLETIKMLLKSFPEAAGSRRGVGRLAIHYACFGENPSIEIINCLLSTYVEGASTTDLYGRLPLHYLLDRHESPSPGAINRLLQAYPDGVRVQDTSGKYPLTLALERGHPATIIRILYEAYPRVVIDSKGVERSLLRAYIERIPKPRVDIVRYIISAEEQITEQSQSSRDSDAREVVSSCSTRGLFDIEREVLGSFCFDEKRLKELRWQARRMAIMVANSNEAHDGSSSSSPRAAGGAKPPQQNAQNILKALLMNCEDGFKNVVRFL